MGGPTLALQGDQFFVRDQQAPPPVSVRRGAEETGRAHQRQHGLATPGTAEPQLDAELFHGAHGQSRRAPKMQIERNLAKQRPGAIIHQ